MIKQSSVSISRFFAIFVMVFYFQHDLRADSSYFELFDLEVSGNIKDYIIEDLNEDGFNDLIIFHHDSSLSLFSSIFYQNDEGFKNNADQSIEVDSLAIILDIGNVCSIPGIELLIIKSKGIYFYGQKGGFYQKTPTLLVQNETIFKIPDAKKPLWDFSVDLDGDGFDEIIIPQFDEVKIYAKENGGDNYVLNSVISVYPEATLNESYEVAKSITTSYEIPKMLYIDYNNDDKKDIVVIEGSGLKVFYQSEVNTFSDKNSVHIPLGFGYKSTSTISIGTNGNSEETIGIGHIIDINGDGVFDLIVNKLTNKGSVFNPKKQFQLFFGEKNQANHSIGGRFKETPDQIITNIGFQLSSQLIDINNDEKLDIVIPLVELNIYKIISLFITGKIKMDVIFYVQDKNSRYSELSDLRKSLKIEMGLGGKTKLPVFRVDGDFNGDGNVDLLTNSKQKLLIFYGKRNAGFNKEADVTFPTKIPENGMSSVITKHINNDSKTDIVILNPDNNGKNNLIRLFITK